MPFARNGRATRNFRTLLVVMHRITDAVAHIVQPGRAGVVLFDFTGDQEAGS